MYTYQVKLDWIEQRKGVLASDALDSKIEVVTPPEFPKGIARQWSPEHLFVAAINSCFMTTFLAVAENSGLEFSQFECNAVGTLDRVEGKFRITDVVLSPVLTLGNGNMTDKAMRVMEMSEKACLISNSINSQITLHAKVVVTDKLIPEGQS